MCSWATQGAHFGRFSLHSSTAGARSARVSKRLFWYGCFLFDAGSKNHADSAVIVGYPLIRPNASVPNFLAKDCRLVLPLACFFFRMTSHATYQTGNATLTRS